MADLPDYIRRPLERAFSETDPAAHVAIGYVSATCTAWTAEVNGSGVLLGGAARIMTPGDYQAWKSMMMSAAAARGEQLMIFELGNAAPEIQH